MNTNEKLCTDDKLLYAAIELVSEKGYNGASTQEIANLAGLSEKTLFRKFGSKQNLIECAFQRIHYADEMTKLFEEQLVGDLEVDLLLISRKYHEVMSRNRKLVLISIREEHLMPGLREKTSQHPKQLLLILTNYLKEMADQGKIVIDNAEAVAISFMMMNFGAFVNRTDNDEVFPEIPFEVFIGVSVKVFARGLTP